MTPSDTDPPDTEPEGTWSQLDALALGVYADLGAWIAEHAYDTKTAQREALALALAVQGAAIVALDHLAILAAQKGGPTAAQKKQIGVRIMRLREVASSIVASNPKE